MSYAEWQREPSTWDVLFRLQMPYRAPRGKLAVFLWRRRIWIETTFALSMMQPWEKVVVVCMGCLLLGLFATTGYLYFPQHVRYVCGRALYYLLGSELRVPTALKSYLVPWGEINASRPFDVLGIHGDL
ncbi:uncharacterized protein C8Q71DRAFT_717379 [Rhodofomes roseus]|uniref:Uncharacterized protein n=1 Tax=Rhodofomes roseus TaxID=34475 RepID=A0ABQ8K0M9_9APHY|nr:uncharacterized protein C8Q71DRAFT_717379 [Rhodofomes roseus]KAH9830210.1 hypothetical protein C8Q71DRAFT_717379 [Rhodofomes roseus]